MQICYPKLNISSLEPFLIYVNMTKPPTSEYSSFFNRYIKLVPEGDYLQVLKQNTRDVQSFFLSIEKEKHDYRYAPGKWSIRDMVLHISDTERVMSYRALTI